jgi:AraC-like DNA-binding protein
MGGAARDRKMEFSGSILKGVEIKLCSNDAHAYKPHVHNELSLGYIVEGSTDLTLGSGVVRFEEGDGVVIPPLTTHICAPHDADRWAYAMLFVDPGFYGDVVGFRQARKLSRSETGALTGFIEQLLHEENPDALESILIELLLEFGESGAADATENPGDAVQAIHAYIADHAGEEIALERLERLSGLNRFSIIRSFKKQYVTTPAAYHLQCRVAQAKELMSKGAGALDACAALGFYDQAHFIREFKKMYGVTPGKYAGQLKR